MNTRCLFFFALLIAHFSCLSSVAYAIDYSANKQPTITENKGQVTDQFGNSRSDIDFRLVGKGVNLFVGSGHLHYQWSAATGHSADDWFTQPVEMYRMDIEFIGANTNAQIVRDGSIGTERYYTPGTNGTPVNKYASITYKNIYPGIDWVLHVKDGIPEYDFIVHPGGKISDIIMSYGGTTSLNIEVDGSLKATTPYGFISDHAPIAFQDDSKSVPAKFIQTGNRVRFDIKPYEGTLTIDPAIDWGTYIGGLLYDQIYQTVVDDSGYVYIAGSTASTSNIVTTGSYQTIYGGGTGASNYLGDAFVAKFNTAGQCLWSTYYGGSNTDQGMSVAIDTGNNVYLCGFTQSTSGIATTGSHQDASGGASDAFLVKFNSSGARQWATYYGGSGNENIKTSVSCDTFGNVYLSGITASTSNIASTGAYQTLLAGGNDAFMVKFNASGVRQWGTYYGGSGSDIPFQHTNDIYGNVYLTGYTTSTSGIATSGSYLSSAAGGDDGFIVKFNTTGQRVWGTYFGGSLLDRSFGIVCDDSTHFYISGITKSTSGIATSGTHLTTYAGGTQDAFIAMFDTSGTMQWGTYYGGSGSDVAGASICKGILGSIYLSGSSPSTTGIATTNGMYTSLSGASDAYVSKFNSSGQQVWGSYIGGLDVEVAYSAAADKFGNLYIAGQTSSSSNIATTGGYQNSLGGGTYDGFLIKVNDCDIPAQPSIIAGSATVCKGTRYKYSIAPMSGVTSYTWTLPAGWSGSSTVDSIVVIAGATNGTISVVANTPCTSSPSQTLAVNVNLVASITPSGYHKICDGDSIVLTANTGVNLNWKWLKGTTILAGATADTFSVKTAGYYSVIIDNGTCVDTSVADTVLVNPVPIPVVSLAGTDLTTTSFVNYQWYHAGTLITGALNQVYTPITSGYYAVKVTDTNGCTGISAYFPFGDVTSVKEPVGTKLISVFPNPVSDYLQILSSSNEQFELNDAVGRTVIKGALPAIIDMREVPQGFYVLKAFNNEGKLLQIEKVAKQ